MNNNIIINKNEKKQAFLDARSLSLLQYLVTKTAAAQAMAVQHHRLGPAKQMFKQMLICCKSERSVSDSGALVGW